MPNNYGYTPIATHLDNGVVGHYHTDNIMDVVAKRTARDTLIRYTLQVVRRTLVNQTHLPSFTRIRATWLPDWH